MIDRGVMNIPFAFLSAFEMRLVISIVNLLYSGCCAILYNINKSISDSVGVSYVNITDISRANLPGLVAPDNLHPSGKQYKLWVDNMYALMKQKIYAR